METARSAMAEFKRLNPGYTIGTFKAEAVADAPAFLLQRERYYEGLRNTGLAE